VTTSAEAVVATDAVYGRLNVNVALDRPTFAISVYPETPGAWGLYVASKAVDGNADTQALKVDNSCFISLSQANPWWAVDLGAALAVVGVRFTNRGEGFGKLYLLCCRYYKTSDQKINQKAPQGGCGHRFGSCRKFKSPLTLTLILDRVKVTSTYTVRVGLPACPTM